MIRTIEAFHQDEHGDWVADLSCLHGQHVRHQPPFRERPWVDTAAGRDAHVGTQLDCPLCDRAELPAGLEVVRIAGPFDGDSLPAGLRRTHRVADGAWGLLRVLDGSVRFRMAVEPPLERSLGAGDSQAIPPGVDHRLELHGRVLLQVEFLGRTGRRPRRGRLR